jgi:hypothetical protein
MKISPFPRYSTSMYFSRAYLKKKKFIVIDRRENAKELLNN